MPNQVAELLWSAGTSRCEACGYFILHMTRTAGALFSGDATTSDAGARCAGGGYFHC